VPHCGFVKKLQPWRLSQSARRNEKPQPTSGGRLAVGIVVDANAGRLFRLSFYMDGMPASPHPMSVWMRRPTVTDELAAAR